MPAAHLARFQTTLVAHPVHRPGWVYEDEPLFEGGRRTTVTVL